MRPIGIVSHSVEKTPRLRIEGRWCPPGCLEHSEQIILWDGGRIKCPRRPTLQEQPRNRIRSSAGRGGHWPMPPVVVSGVTRPEIFRLDDHRTQRQSWRSLPAFWPRNLYGLDYFSLLSQTRGEAGPSHMSLS